MLICQACAGWFEKPLYIGNSFAKWGPLFPIYGVFWIMLNSSKCAFIVVMYHLSFAYTGYLTFIVFYITIYLRLLTTDFWLEDHDVNSMRTHNCWQDMEASYVRNEGRRIVTNKQSTRVTVLYYATTVEPYIGSNRHLHGKKNSLFLDQSFYFWTCMRVSFL